MAQPLAGTRSLPRISPAYVASTAVGSHLGQPVPAIVLRAPRGWGKTTTAAAWMDRLEEEHRYVWITVPRPLDEDEFWTLVLDGIAPGLSTWRDLTDDLVERIMPGRSAHLWLVVDNLHLADSRAVDEALVEIAAGMRRVHIIVTSRDDRLIETLAPLEADGHVYDAPLLRLAGPEVRKMASLLGHEIDDQSAETLTRELGGWPALMRGALLHGQGHGHRPGAVAVADDARRQIVQYLHLVVSELADETTVHDLMSLALAGSSYAAPELPAEPTVALDRLRSNGLVDDDGHMPTSMAGLWAEVFATAEPKHFHSQHVHLAAWHEQRGQIGLALAHAVKAADPNLSRRLLHEHWLTAAHHPETTRQALALLPPEDAHDDPRITVLRAHLDLGGSTTEISRSPDGARAKLQWCVNRIGAMDFSPRTRATVLEVYEDALAVGEPLLVREAAAVAALYHAAIGSIVDARAWLPTDRGRPAADPIADLVRLLCMLDELRLETAEPGYEAARERNDDLTRWSWHPPWLHLLEAPIKAAHTAHIPEQRPAAMAALSEQLAPPTSDGSAVLPSVWTAKALATCFIAEGNYAHCSHLLENFLSEHAAMNPTRARFALYRGEDTRALSLSERRASEPTSTPRDDLEYSLIRACAFSRLDRPDSARAEAERARDISERYGLVRPFTLIPSGELQRLRALVPTLGAALDLDVLRVVADALGPERAPIALTAAEVRILSTVATSPTLASAANHLYISVNTAKSQLRSAYRKLSVNTRADAIARARDLAILPGPVPADEAAPPPSAPR